MELRLHPAARAFPEMREDEKKALLADIKARGQQLPILVVIKDDVGEIVDGRHRWEVCKVLGWEPKVQIVPDGTDPYLLAASMNAVRRQLTAGQRAAAASDLKKMRKAAGLAAKRGKAGASAVIKTGEENEVVAKACGVSSNYVKRFEIVVRENPSLADEVRRGALALPAAEKALAVSAGQTVLGREVQTAREAEAVQQIALAPWRDFCRQLEAAERSMTKAMQCALRVDAYSLNKASAELDRIMRMFGAFRDGQLDF